MSGKVISGIRQVDTYEVKIKRKSLLGGVISVLVLSMAVASTVYDAVMFTRRPTVTTNNFMMSWSHEPFSLPFTCVALNGCYVSNRRERDWTTPSLVASVEEAGCRHMSYNETSYFSLVHNLNIARGLSFIFDNTATSPVYPSSYGVVVDTEYSYVNGTRLLVPLSNGVTNMEPIVTVPLAGNISTTWLLTEGDTRGDIKPGMTECMTMISNMTNMAQTRIRLDAHFTHVDVTRPGSWRDVVGNAGGTLSLLLSVGGWIIVVFTCVEQLDVPPQSTTDRRNNCIP
jgi:hypothetical protein